MKERLAKLIDVKSIVTILLCIIFCILSCFGKINPEQFMAIFTMIIGFYFGTQKAKNEIQ